MLKFTLVSVFPHLILLKLCSGSGFFQLNNVVLCYLSHIESWIVTLHLTWTVQEGFAHGLWVSVLK